MSHMLNFFRYRPKSINRKTPIENHCQRLIGITIIGGLFFCASSAFCQNTTIIFKTKESSTISISKEIDNTYTRVLTDEISTDATGYYIYSWNVHNFQFVGCSFHDGGRAFFPIKEGSHLTITYKGNRQFEIEGADKTEVEFYINGYKEDITRPFLNSLSKFSAKSSFENLSLLIEKYDSVLSNTLDSLVTEDAISQKFSDIVKNDFYTIIASTGIGIYRTKYLEDETTKVKGEDSIRVESLINGLLDKISPMIDSGDILKHNLGVSSLAVYYTNKYRHLNKKDKEELLSRKTWANYLEPNRFGYLLAPEELQYKLLSLKLLSNYESAIIEGDTIFFNYISEIRPQNAFIPYLKEKQGELLASMNANHSEIKYIEGTINTLEDLTRITDFTKKILYIDLWASWCAPCIAEFKHKDKVHELLLNYKDIIPVYISINEDSDDILWKAKTKAFNLNGYHLRASKELTTDIREKLYEGGIFGIPRYILLNKDGRILEENLPRPAQIAELKRALDEVLLE